MASVRIDGYAKYIEEFQKLSGKALDGACKAAVYEGAGYMASSLTAAAEKVTENSETSTGDLAKSVGISRIRLDKQNNWSAKVGFSGRDRSGTPNIIKARVLNSGSTRIKKTEFATKAIKQARRQTQMVMQHAFDERMYDLTKDL